MFATLALNFIKPIGQKLWLTCVNSLLKHPRLNTRIKLKIHATSILVIILFYYEHIATVVLTNPSINTVMPSKLIIVCFLLK